MNAQFEDGSSHAADVSASVKAVGNSSTALSNEFRNFVSDIEDLVKSSTSLTGDELAKAKDKIKDRISSAKVSLASAGDSIAQRARRTATATNEYVNDEPWKAIAIGAAAGFFVGVLVARR